MLTCIINSMKGRDVAIADIPDAFLQTDMVNGDCTVSVRICGVLADIMDKTDPEKFANNVVQEGGQKVIYAYLKKALYGALIGILLFRQDLSGVLGSWGFKPNPYDSCVMNKKVNSKQFTNFWRVDDLKIFHVILKIVDGVLSKLTTKYGKVSSLSVSRGRTHDYLSMRLDHSTK